MMQTDLQATFSQIDIRGERYACTIAPIAGGGFIDLPGVTASNIAVARLDGKDIRYDTSPEGIRVEIAESAQTQRLEIYFSSLEAQMIPRRP
jgi:putative isomerase